MCDGWMMYGPHGARLGLSSPDPVDQLSVLRLDRPAIRQVTVVSVAVFAALAVGHVLYLLVPSVQVLDIFDLGREQSVGTWVASSLHLMCAALSAVGAVVARRERSRWVANWWLLAAAFLVLSADETAAGHDRLTGILQDRVPTSGPLLYSWVVVAGLLGLCFLLVQVGFLRSLRRPTGRHLVLAGVLFVLGAAGLEIAEGVVASPGGAGFESLPFRLLILAEELLELGASMWVLRILLTHLSVWLAVPRVVPGDGWTAPEAQGGGGARG